MCFGAAVRLAANSFFGFTHRSALGGSLWSDAVSVWLGRATYLHWSMCEAKIDIPRIVADVAGAPEDVDALREAVLAELTAYWAECLGALPAKTAPGWLPLP